MKNYILYGLIAILIIIIVLCFTQKANADTVNLSLTNTNYDYSFPVNNFLDDTSTGFELSYGYQLVPDWHLKFSYADLGSAEQTILGIHTKFELQTYSIAAEYSYTITTIAGHNLKLHGLLGITQSEAKASAGLLSLSDSDTGLTYGIGASIWLGVNSAIALMYKKSNLDFNDPTILSIGYTHQF